MSFESAFRLFALTTTSTASDNNNAERNGRAVAEAADAGAVLGLGASVETGGGGEQSPAVGYQVRTPLGRVAALQPGPSDSLDRSPDSDVPGFEVDASRRSAEGTPARDGHGVARLQLISEVGQKSTRQLFEMAHYWQRKYADLTVKPWTTEEQRERLLVIWMCHYKLWADRVTAETTKNN